MRRKKVNWSASATVIPVLIKYERKKTDYLQRLFQPFFDLQFKEFKKKWIKEQIKKQSKNND